MWETTKEDKTQDIFKQQVLPLSLSTSPWAWTISSLNLSPFCQSESESRSVVSDSLQPYGLYSPWNSRVGSLSLLQGIFPTQGSNPGLPLCRQILYQLSRKGSPKGDDNTDPAEMLGVFSEITGKTHSSIFHLLQFLSPPLPPTMEGYFFK